MPVLTRRTLACALLFGPTALQARSVPCPPPPTVLFVCPAGSVKSAIARETLKARAAQAGLPVRAQSRGLKPEDHVSHGLAARLKADGVDPSADPLQALRAEDVTAATVVIAFDDAAADPMLRGARTWTSPSWNADYPAAKTALTARMDDLIGELARLNPAGCHGTSQ